MPKYRSKFNAESKYYPERFIESKTKLLKLKRELEKLSQEMDKDKIVCQIIGEMETVKKSSSQTAVRVKLLAANKMPETEAVRKISLLSSNYLVLLNSYQTINDELTSLKEPNFDQFTAQIKAINESFLAKEAEAPCLLDRFYKDEYNEAFLEQKAIFEQLAKTNTQFIADYWHKWFAEDPLQWSKYVIIPAIPIFLLYDLIKALIGVIYKTCLKIETLIAQENLSHFEEDCLKVINLNPEEELIQLNFELGQSLRKHGLFKTITAIDVLPDNDVTPNLI